MNNKEILDKLWKILLMSYHTLNEFDEVFPNNPKQIELLNKAAPSFFAHVREMYFNSLFLSISKFFDPIEQFGHKNLSIYILLELADNLHYNKKNEVETKIESIKNNITHIIEYRRKYLAHLDFDFAFEIFKINRITKIEDIRTTCDSILELLNIFFVLIGEKPKVSVLMRDIRGACSLINVLKQWSVYKDIQYLKENPQLFYEAQKQNKFMDL